MSHSGREEKIQPVEVLLRRVMPPLYDAREKLEKIILAWDEVVGPVLGKQSAPIDIVNNEFIVAAENPLAGNQVAMMKGNISRALAERWNLEVMKIKVVVRRLPLKTVPRTESCTARPPTVLVREEDVREFSSFCLANLPDFPEDAAESLARLRAFFIKRFKRKNNSQGRMV